ETRRRDRHCRRRTDAGGRGAGPGAPARILDGRPLVSALGRVVAAALGAHRRSRRDDRRHDARPMGSVARVAPPRRPRQPPAHPPATRRLEAAAGRYLGYVRVVGRRTAATLEPYCWPDTLRVSPVDYVSKPLLRSLRPRS